MLFVFSNLNDLNENVQKSIDLSREQIKKGHFHSNENVISEMKEWLSKK